MEYIRLPDLINTYPQPGNYIRQSKDKTALFGIYSDVNKLDFELPNIDDIKIINNTTFRFILGIRKNSNDTDIKYYTSRRYLIDLRESQSVGNPYFSQFSVLESYIVTVEWELFELLVRNLYPIEIKHGVLVGINNSIERGDIQSGEVTVNYELIGRYVDWLVSPANPNDLSSDGVIPAVGLGSWYEGKYNPVLGYFEFGETELESPLGEAASDDYGKKPFDSNPNVKYAPFGEKGGDLQFRKFEKTQIWYYWNESLQFWQRYGLEYPSGLLPMESENLEDNTNLPPPISIYQPIGRRGLYAGEVITFDDVTYQWIAVDGGRWVRV